MLEFFKDYDYMLQLLKKLELYTKNQFQKNWHVEYYVQ